MPSFALPTQSSSPDALMAIDSPQRALHRIDDRDGECDENNEDIFNDADRRSGSPTPRIRIKSAMRPRSYHQILEDFQRSEKGLPGSGGSRPMMGTGSTTSHQDETESSAGLESESVTGSSPQTPVDRQLSTPWRKEDTVRRHKRFSLPAIALQNTPVTARPNAFGVGKSKRFSLVLGGRSSGQQAQNDVPYEVREPGLGKGDLSSGVAAVKLGELLGRQKK
jgi:FYVE/RhoGEF/PH domain-containing protein 5/6